MNVRELRELLAKLPDGLPVAIEVTFGDGDELEGAELQSAKVEARCDEVERLYLWGDQDVHADDVVTEEESSDFMDDWHPGFVRVTPFDSAGRRAMWIRFDRVTGTLDLRSGREGDDAYVLLAPGMVLDRKTIADLLGLIDRARNDCGGDDRVMPWQERG